MGLLGETFLETLIESKEVTINNEKYIIKIEKWEYDRVSGTDYYTYHCYLYKKCLREKGLFFKKTVEEYTEIYRYTTYWLDYYKFRGDISKVINYIVENYMCNIKEREKARIVEEQYVLAYKDEEFKMLKSPNE